MKEDSSGRQSQDSSLNSRKSDKPKNVKQTGGVADYFTILGVGDDLLWKHTQKQREEQQLMSQQLQQQQEDGGEAKNPSQNEDLNEPLDPNQEDQAALLERFYREIISVTILTHQERFVHAPPTLNAPSSVAPTSSIILASAPSIDTDVNTVDGANSLASSRVRAAYQGHQQGGIFQSPSSHSEATTVATTILSASDTAGAGLKQATTLPPSEIDGFTVVSRTNPPRRNFQANNYFNTAPQQQPSPPNNIHGVGNPLSASFSHGMDTAVLQTSFPWNHASNQPSRYHGPQSGAANTSGNKDAYVFDANLHSSGGLRDQVCTTVLQWEESLSDQNNNNPSKSSGASVGGSSTGGASLKGLRRKVESSFLRWNQGQSQESNNKSLRFPHSNIGNHQSSTRTKFYLGYKRRTPDKDYVPAIADIQLFFVRLPRQTTTTPPSHNLGLVVQSPTAPSPPGSSAAGYLAGRVAAAAGQVLFRSQTGSDAVASHDNAKEEASLSSHHQHEDFQRVDLEPLLPLPAGFDEWSIPEAFKVVYVPKPEASPPLKSSNVPPSPAQKANDKLADGLRQKTVLVASPSHGQRRHHHHQQNLSPPYHSNRDDENLNQQLPGNSSTYSEEEEAVEAYVKASFSPPVSPKPQGDEEPTLNEIKDTTHVHNSSSTSFVPELFTDIPWEEDQHQHDDAHQPHHPFYHTEERWFYLPVLAVRKQKTTDEERYHEDPGVVDVCVSFCDKAGTAVMPQEQDDFMDDIMMDDSEEEFSLLSKTSWLVAKDGDNSCLGTEDPNGGLLTGTYKKKPSNNSITTVKKNLGSPSLLVKRNVPIGFADIAFATRVLDRFPLKNYKGLPLPEEELPMFCYPTGCKLHRAPYSDAPLPEYYGFVVKNERGDSIYVSCVSFFEPLAKQKIEQLSNMSEKRRRTSLAHRTYCEKRERRRRRKEGQLYSSDDAEPFTVRGSFHEGVDNDHFDEDDDDDESNNCIMTAFDDMTTFENKTICLVSRYPFWTAFRRFLSHLHILSGSSSDLPLERCISHLLLTVPVPKHGGPNVIVPLPALNQPMILSLPPLKDFPLVDLPYHRLMACLDIPTIVTIVLGFLALERKVRERRRHLYIPNFLVATSLHNIISCLVAKVVIMSTRPSLVLDACELLRSLLFPFDLCAPYVPRLTEPFMSCLEFPGAIFVGIHDDGCSDGLAAVVRKSPPEDSIIVDLDTGTISCSGNR